VINDTKGHEAGDKYITECAYLLKEVLATSGSIFRVGGDEFCILLHATKVKEAEEFLVRVDEAFEKYNKTHPEMPLSIAYGCAKYDKLTDMDLNDTRSRADSEMYHNKFKMKEKRV
jgi:diguanylate cyclase (GGDEF)-like protein